MNVILDAVKRAIEKRHRQPVTVERSDKQDSQPSEISALYDVTLDLVSQQSVPQVLENLLIDAVDLLRAKGGDVYLYDEPQGILVAAASRGPWKEDAGHTLALGEGLAGKVAQSGQPLRVDDYPTWEGRSPQYQDAGFLSAIGVPLMAQDRVVGVLSIEDDVRRNGFSAADEALLMRLALVGGVAVERARLHSQTEAQLAEVSRAHQEISALQDLTAAIQSSLALPEVLNRIAEGVVRGLGYRAAMVAVYDARKDALVIKSAVLDPDVWAQGEALAGMGLLDAYLTMDHTENLAISSARRGEVSVTHHLVDLFRPAVDESTAQMLQEMAGVRTLATVPLMAAGQLVGNFFAGSQRDSLSETEIASLQAFARQAALAIEHARLFEEERRRHKIANTLAEVSRAINSTLELEEVLSLVLEGLEAVFEYDSSAILLLERGGLQVRAIRGKLSSEALGKMVSAGAGSLGGLALDAQRPVVIANVQNHPGWHAAPFGQQIRGWIGAPLIARGEAIGLLSLNSHQEDVYDEEDARVVMAFAHQAALAIQNTRLFTQEAKRRRLADILRGISAIIGATLDLGELQSLILEQVSWVFPYDSCGLFSFEDGRPKLLGGRRFSTPTDIPVADLDETPQSLFTTLLKGRHALVLSKVPEKMQWPAAGPDKVQSWIGAPLIVREEVIGFLTINSYAAHTFHQDDEEHAMAFARQIAAAIANARLFTEAERNLREQKYLQEIAQVFNSTLDLDQVLTLVMAKTNELLGVEAGSVALLAEDGEELIFHAAVGGGSATVKGFTMPANRGIVGWVASHGKSLLVPDVAQDPRHYELVDAQSGFETRSILCVPLIAKGAVIGAIEVLNKIGGLFDADDLRMTEALALSAATAIENASLFQREKETLQKLRETQDELIRAQRLAALGQIGVTVRHEVNNPLTVVLGNADWLLQELANLEGESLKAMEAIRANAIRIRDIINKLEDIKTDAVTQYVGGIEMIDIHGRGAQTEQGEEAN
jgi:GAF domain-containing protein